MINNFKEFFEECKEWAKVIGVFCLILLLLSFMIGFKSYFHSLLYCEEDVNCKVSSKYIEVDEGSILSFADYYVRLESDDLSDDVKVSKKVYDFVSVGDEAEAVARYDDLTGDFLGFYNVKFINTDN